MREFEFYELSTFRCRICGCKNKLYTELIKKECTCGPKKVVGYSTRCCNCGHSLEWYFDNCGEIAHLNHEVVAGCSKCIQPSPCAHKECKLYGTCDIFPPKKKKKKQIAPGISPCSKNSDQHELNINYSMSPKYL